MLVEPVLLEPVLLEPEFDEEPEFEDVVLEAEGELLEVEPECLFDPVLALVEALALDEGCAEALGVDPVLVVSLPWLPVFGAAEVPPSGAAKEPFDTAVADWPRYQDAPSTPRVTTEIVVLVELLTRQTPLREFGVLRFLLRAGS